MPEVGHYVRAENSSWTTKCDTAKYSRLNSYAGIGLVDAVTICADLVVLRMVLSSGSSGMQLLQRRLSP